MICWLYDMLTILIQNCLNVLNKFQFFSLLTPQIRVGTRRLWSTVWKRRYGIPERSYNYCKSLSFWFRHSLLLHPFCLLLFPFDTLDHTPRMSLLTTVFFLIPYLLSTYQTQRETFPVTDKRSVVRCFLTQPRLP